MKRTDVRIYFLISLMIHLLLVMSWGLSEYLRPRAETEKPEDAEDELRFAFELIEVPDHVPEEKPDALTNLVSDRDARAADENPEQMDDQDDPYTEGVFEFREYPQPESEESESDPSRPPEELETTELAEVVVPESGIDYLDEMKRPELRQRSVPTIGSENLESSTPRQGGISFNTYNWDFAPYMLAMKRKVQRNLYPPYAFTHMGAVSGTTIVRFVVMPDGQVRDLRVLESDAHVSLDRASVSAIAQSIPFLPLPHNFPEDFLEVTAAFSYLVNTP